ncbi:hypothetical protein [Glaciimonas soli]|uniref:Uncharacterized protein n=1 Tax=Glaciimonas soli TaxID=2590999 RepID=A0A843YQN5_9BURK|nr:hypothetical protein [Glaciimonas soli]MQR02079.1 hypothetical protein [Glaciimonas soli]
MTLIALNSEKTVLSKPIKWKQWALISEKHWTLIDSVPTDADQNHVDEKSYPFGIAHVRSTFFSKATVYLTESMTMLNATEPNMLSCNLKSAALWHAVAH